MDLRIKNTFFLTIIALSVAANIFADDEAADKVVKALSFEPETAVVSYELAYPAKVRIRIGTKEGPLLRTIVDWQERGIGLHKEEWDGFDASKKVKLIGNHDLVFTFNYFTADDAFLKNVSLGEIMPHPEQLVVGRFLPSLNINRLHKNHSPEYCHEPELTVKLPKNTKMTKEGYTKIKEPAIFVIDISKKDKAWFTRERYSIHIFIDDIFFTGELEGYSPYNFVFDPKQVNPGKHLIAINYSGFNDHIGIINIPVYIEKKGT